MIHWSFALGAFIVGVLIGAVMIALVSYGRWDK